mgnify:CR=1 FL=1
MCVCFPVCRCAARDALAQIDHSTESNTPKVAYARDWQRGRERNSDTAAITDVLHYDWTFTSTYRASAPDTAWHAAVHRADRG